MQGLEVTVVAYHALHEQLHGQDSSHLIGEVVSEVDRLVHGKRP
jgi:hypothetical protein